MNKKEIYNDLKTARQCVEYNKELCTNKTCRNKLCVININFDLEESIGNEMS